MELVLLTDCGYSKYVPAQQSKTQIVLDYATPSKRVFISAKGCMLLVCTAALCACGLTVALSRQPSVNRAKCSSKMGGLGSQAIVLQVSKP